VVGEVGQLAEQARPFIEAGDGRSALAILEAVTEEYVARWADLDDSDGEASGLFEELGPLWTEAILSADLTPAERRAWAKRLGDGLGMPQVGHTAADGHHEQDRRRLVISRERVLNQSQGGTRREAAVGQDQAAAAPAAQVLA
jgi:hypothetical protein